MDVEARLARRAAQVNQALMRYLPPPAAEPRRLHESMHYSVFAGGKRLRPALVLETCAAVGGNEQQALPAACALECLHTYSLVHDDLPALDDDDLRRGKAANHRVFGEAVAILCGDALLTQAFLLLSRGQSAAGVPAATAVETTALVAEAAGSLGMVGGQTVDIASEGQPVDAGTLDYIHRHKTGLLLRAAVECGAVLGGAGGHLRRQLREYGECLGLAFQIVDDLLDLESTTAELGKRPQADRRRGKATYPGIHGVSTSRRRVKELTEAAKAAVTWMGASGTFLRDLADHLAGRTA